MAQMFYGRRSQPYRQNSNVRFPGPALSAMLQGRPLALMNPMDLERETLRRGANPRRLSALIQSIAQRRRV